MVLAYKITPPSTPECISRPRLLDMALASSVVVLLAPAGYGKTYLAAQIPAATGGPTAWFTAYELDRDRASAVAHPRCRPSMCPVTRVLERAVSRLPGHPIGAVPPGFGVTHDVRFARPIPR